jgi:hypothetical protein
MCCQGFSQPLHSQGLQGCIHGSEERCAIQSPSSNKDPVSTGYDATFLKAGKGPEDGVIHL